MQILRAFVEHKLNNFRTWVSNQISSDIASAIKVYEGSYSTVQLNGTYTYYHGLATNPHLYGVDIKCVATGGANGHSYNTLIRFVGGCIELHTYQVSALDLRLGSPAIWAPTASQFKVRLPPSFQIGYSGGYTSLTAASWNMRGFALRWSTG